MIGHQENRRRLQQFIETEGHSLRQTLRYYVLRAGLASGSAANLAADDLLNEVMVEAFKFPERLKPDVQPRAWLLGIAANLIKRQQVERAKRERREPLLRDLYPHMEDSLSDEELFDQLPIMGETSLAELEENEQISMILSGLSEGDAGLLRLAILHDMNGESLAKALGVTANAARVRLHRALHRLRDNHQRQRSAADE
jgi:RNA polymerase sigma factor (sigma-70 family)